MALTQAQYDRLLYESKALPAGNVTWMGDYAFSGGKAYTRDEWGAKRAAENTAAASQLQSLGVDQGTASRYAGAATAGTLYGGQSMADIARRLGAMGRARERTALAGQYQRQGLSAPDARAQAKTAVPGQWTSWDSAMRDAAQLIPGGGNVNSTSHWIFGTPQGKELLAKYGLTGAGVGANSPAVLADRGGTGWYEGQNYVSGRPVSEADFRTYSGMTQDNLNKAALARRTAELRAVQGNTGATLAPAGGRVLDDQGNVIVPGTAPRFGMAPTVPRMAPPAPPPQQETPSGGGTESGWVIPYGQDSGGAIVPPSEPPPDEAAGLIGGGDGAPAGEITGPNTGAPGAAPSAIQPRPMSPEVQTLLNELRRRMGQPPLTAADIMQSPEYQAQAGAIDFQRESAQAQLRRAMASRNMLRSTPAIQSLASSDAYYTAQEAALIPQMLQAAVNQRKAGLGEYYDLLNTISGLEGTAFNQGVTEFQTLAPYQYETVSERTRRTEAAAKAEADAVADAYKRSLDEAELTGRYMPPGAQALIEEVFDAKRRYGELIAAGDREGAKAQNLRAAAARQKLTALGIDASLFGADVTLEQATTNVSLAGIMTLKAQRDAIDMQIKQLEYQIANDPDIGKRAEAEAKMAKLFLDMDRIDSQIQVNLNRLNDTGTDSTTKRTLAENEFAGLVAQSLSGGMTVDQIKAEIRKHPGDLQGISLEDALALVDVVAGTTKADPQTKAELENPVYLALSGLKQQGKTYDDALQWLQANPDKWSKVSAETIDKWLEGFWPVNAMGERQ